MKENYTTRDAQHDICIVHKLFMRHASSVIIGASFRILSACALHTFNRKHEMLKVIMLKNTEIHSIQYFLSIDIQCIFWYTIFVHFAIFTFFLRNRFLFPLLCSSPAYSFLYFCVAGLVQSLLLQPKFFLLYLWYQFLLFL